MNYQDIRHILTEYFKMLYEREEQRIAIKGPRNPQSLEILRNSYDLATSALEDEDYDDYGSDEQLGSFIRKRALDIKPGDPAYAVFRTEYVKAFRDYFRSILERHDELNTYNFKASATLPTQQARKPSNDKKLAACIEGYVEEKLRLGNWDDKTARNFGAQLNLMAEYLGVDASLHIPSDVANDIKLMLMEIPQRARSLPDLKKMSIAELRQVKHRPRMSPQSIQKYLHTYSAFYDWVVKRKETDENNFKGLIDKLPPTEQSRDAYTPEQIILMLEEITENKHGLMKKNFHKWGVLIGIYTGARLNEIAQLELDDIRQIDGIWCFDFNDEGETKKLKNVASKRIIPIHSRLLEFGLLAFVDQLRKDRHKRLLHELGFTKSNGYGQSLSRWFNNQFLETLDMKSKRLKFHCFRHTITARLLQAGVDEPIVKSIVGHTQQGVTQRVYGKGYTILQMQEALERFNPMA